MTCRELIRQNCNHSRINENGRLGKTKIKTRRIENRIVPAFLDPTKDYDEVAICKDIAKSIDSFIVKRYQCLHTVFVGQPEGKTPQLCDVEMLACFIDNVEE